MPVLSLLPINRAAVDTAAVTANFAQTGFADYSCYMPSSYSGRPSRSRQFVEQLHVVS
jgi:hypothetical protein